MIKSIAIKNFKSVVDLKLELGQFNVLIGENGCGKSNILEGIAFGAAADVNKLDREFFSTRGIRMTEPEFVYSAFDDIESKIVIHVEYTNDNSSRFELVYNFNSKPAKWEDARKTEEMDEIHERIFNYLQKSKNKIEVSLGKRKSDIEIKVKGKSSKQEVVMMLNNIINDLNTDSQWLNGYLIYSLEESILRRFDAENAIHPLGRNGEGIFAYLKELSQKENGMTILEEIKENLSVLDWFDTFEIPKEQLFGEFSLQIKDKYINDTLRLFDQRSTNEGFLYLLFYLTLFISDDTPAFFAIDNLEASFNPKLCREITKRLILLAKKHNKQVIVTTHSPAILDGLDITDDKERLFVVRRDLDGHTKVNRITYKKPIDLPLSEAWVKGYLGGLPNNF